MKTDLDNIKKAFTILLSGTVILSILGVVNTLVIAKDIGSGYFGVFAILTSYTLVIDKLVNFQSWQGLIKYATNYLDNKGKVADVENFHKVINSCVLLDISTAVLGFFVSIIFLPFLIDYFNWESKFDINIDIFYIFMISMAFKFSSFSLGVFRVFNKHKTQVRSNLTPILVRTTLILLTYVGNGSLETYLLIWGGTEVLMNISLAYNAMKCVRNETQKKVSLLNGIYKDASLLKFVAWTNLSSIIDLPAKELDVMMVGILTNDKEAGYYKLAKQCMTLIGRLASPLYQVIYPIQVKYISKNSLSDSIKISNKVSFLILAFTPIIITLSYLMVPNVIDSYMGDTYTGLGMLAVIAIGVKSIDVIFTTYHALFIALGYVKLNVVILFVANVFLISSFFVFVPLGGAEYALYCIGIQALMTFLMKYLYILWKKNER